MKTLDALADVVLALSSETQDESGQVQDSQKETA